MSFIRVVFVLLALASLIFKWGVNFKGPLSLLFSDQP